MPAEPTASGKPPVLLANTGIPLKWASVAILPQVSIHSVVVPFDERCLGQGRVITLAHIVKC